MNSQMFSNLLFVISVTVTFAARLTDDQLAQILNEKLDRGPASESKDYAPLDDISELKRRIFALESLGDITDQMLDTGNGRSDTEDVLHNPYGRKEDVYPSVLEGLGRLPSNIDDKNILSEDTEPDEVGYYDDTVDADTLRERLLLPKKIGLNTGVNNLYPSAVKICEQYVLSLKGSFSKCLREHGLGSKSGDCIGRQCKKEPSGKSEGTDKRSLLCPRYGCKMKIKRIPCYTYGCTRNTYTFPQQSESSLLGRVLKTITDRKFFCLGSGCQNHAKSQSQMRLLQSSLNDKVISDADQTLIKMTPNDSNKEDFQFIRAYPHARVDYQNARSSLIGPGPCIGKDNACMDK